MSRFLIRMTGLSAVVGCSAPAVQVHAQSVPDGDWWTTDRDPAGSRFSLLDEI
jgi:hypothetical protein